MSSSFWDWYAALGYDALRAVIPYQMLQEQVCTAVAPAAGERVLVAGCGTGNLEMLAVQRVPDLRIDAVDFSAQMLARARAKCAGYPNVRYSLLDLCEPLPFATASFDAVVMCNVLYALTKQEAALREISRVVRPGGRFILCDRPPMSNPRCITRAHLAALRVLPAGPRVRGWLRTIAALPPLLTVLAVNENMSRHTRSGEFHLFTAQEITDLLSGLGFIVQQVDSAYAEQCWLLQAIRHGSRGGR